MKMPKFFSIETINLKLRIPAPEDILVDGQGL